MDAPERAPADTLALPDARPAITLGEALPFALAFEARRRQAADRRAARKLDRLKRTLRECGELRARLAALCDAATAAAASGADDEDARDGPFGGNAARELMLDAVRGASRARGEPREGKHVFESENTRREGEKNCAACEARAREASLSFAFVREARAFRLAELALSEDPDRGDSRPVGSTDHRNTAAFQRPRIARGTLGLSAKRATATLRGADDPPASFAAGTLLLELVCASGRDDSREREESRGFSRYDHDMNGRDTTFFMPVSDRDADAVIDADVSADTLRDPSVVDADKKRKRDARRAKKAEARVVAAARGFARSLERAASHRSPRDGTKVQRSSSSPSSPSFFRRDTAASSDALRRDVVASLVAAAAPVFFRHGPENTNETVFGSKSATSTVTSARLSLLALLEIANTDVLAGDALVVCASRIREGVVDLQEKRRKRYTRETPAVSPSTANSARELAPAFFRDTETRAHESGVRDERDETTFLKPDDRFDDDDRFESTRASQTLDEFGECQRLGFVFSVAERAARRLRLSVAERSAAASNASSSDAERKAAFARAGLDAARAAAEAATAPDPAKPHDSIALRLIGSRAIRLHAMVCVALGRKAPGTRA